MLGAHTKVESPKTILYCLCIEAGAALEMRTGIVATIFSALPPPSGHLEPQALASLPLPSSSFHNAPSLSGAADHLCTVSQMGHSTFRTIELQFARIGDLE